MDPRLPVAAALLAVAGFVARAADEAREVPRAPAGIPSLLGGFTALAAHVVWIQADRAVQERDDDQAIVLLRTLTDLEPQVVSAARHAAREIGWNMLQGRDDPAVRAALVREALAILDTCVERNPGSAAALRERGRFVFLRVRNESGLAADFEERRHRPAVDAAQDDLRRAFDLTPDDGDISGALALASLEIARRETIDERWDRAATALRTAVRAFDQVLADATAELGAESELAADEREALDGTRRMRAAAAALLDAVGVGDAGRPARLGEVRRLHPELGL